MTLGNIQTSSYILLVDDDSEDRDIFKESLSSLAPLSELVQLDNGAKVRPFLDKAIILPCLIILDHNMPGLNGREVLLKIRQNERFDDIPIVILSTSSLGAGDCIKNGAAAHFVKPNTITEYKLLTQEILKHCA